ncbi:MAG: hypothetical protein ACTSUE_14395 [Promethearchaeota archaeon]
MHNPSGGVPRTSLASGWRSAVGYKAGFLSLANITVNHRGRSYELSSG